jgi:hypothetical protein
MRNRKITDDTKLLTNESNLITEIPNTKGYGYEKLIFTSRQKEKEWEDLEPVVKNQAMQHLKEYANEMSLKVSVEMLCHVINDLHERINKLEEKNAK